MSEENKCEKSLTCNEGCGNTITLNIDYTTKLFEFIDIKCSVCDSLNHISWEDLESNQKSLISVSLSRYCYCCRFTLQCEHGTCDCCGLKLICNCGNYISTKCSVCDIVICEKCFNKH